MNDVAIVRRKPLILLQQPSDPPLDERLRVCGQCGRGLGDRRPVVFARLEQHLDESPLARVRCPVLLCPKCTLAHADDVARVAAALRTGDPDALDRLAHELERERLAWERPQG